MLAALKSLGLKQPLSCRFLSSYSPLKGRSILLPEGADETDEFFHEAPEPKHSHRLAHARRALPIRTGAILRKGGMLSYYDSNGKYMPVTLLEFDRVQVVQVKSIENGDQLCAVQVGAGEKNPYSINKSLYHHYRAHNVFPKLILHEFQVANKACLPKVGTVINADHFKEGQYLDIQGATKGKGFQGVVKRWGFKGGPASHGTTQWHRRGGSVGMRTSPGRIFPGKKMPGRMGGQNRTVQNVKVLKVDTELNCILVKGQIPGPKKAYVYAVDAKKKYNSFDIEKAKENLGVATI